MSYDSPYPSDYDMESICAVCGGRRGLHSHHQQRCPKDVNANKDHTDYRETFFRKESSVDKVMREHGDAPIGNIIPVRSEPATPQPVYPVWVKASEKPIPNREVCLRWIVGSRGSNPRRVYFNSQAFADPNSITNVEWLDESGEQGGHNDAVEFAEWIGSNYLFTSISNKWYENGLAEVGEDDFKTTQQLYNLFKSKT